MRFGLPATLFCALLVSACAGVPSSSAGAAAQTPGEAAAAFLNSFNALDAERFDAFFADDVTMFFPEGPFPKSRVQGKPAVTSAFHRFFDIVKQRGAASLGIQPQEIEVQDYGDFAVVSFHLRGNGNLGRRSLVLRQMNGNWRIVHFHASALKE